MNHGSHGYTHGFGRVTDQVARREAFERAHPTCHISHTDDPWLWTAQWRDGSGTHELIRDELSGLLDALEVALG
jgi:hypothetical protein